MSGHQKRYRRFQSKSRPTCWLADVRCRAAVEDLTQRPAVAIRGGQAEAAALSLEIYRTLFNCLSERFRTAPRWLVAPRRRLGRTPHRCTLGKEGITRPDSGIFAASPQAGHSQVLTPFEISHWHTQAGLVVLSGCHSAAVAPFPGKGALVLPRAWLAVEAESVVGSLWTRWRTMAPLCGVIIPGPAGCRPRPLPGSAQHGPFPPPPLLLGSLFCCCEPRQGVLPQ